ncbi:MULTISPECIES: hypothetical protein [Oleiagrimonas]|uniref:hypothetical protein n=1 Tax=Oleiagrimonas TaxID=1649642 RepID=UPI000DC27385|nr:MULTISPECIES: hypothetical protein [Oleiagrimonas]RAP56906.1 hypothetical protein BTJ49_12220 [Oleiagrimonas sp. MCCC 1A03011]
MHSALPRKTFLPFLASAALLAFCSLFATSASAAPVPLKTPIYGVTLDTMSHFHKTLVSLENLPYKPTVRVVFDMGTPASDYRRKLVKLHKHAYVMGEVMDSYYFPTDLATYKARTQELVNELGDVVDVWEIANEINGEWLRANPNGSNATVNAEEAEIGQMVDAANTIVKNAGGKTAITLYYNDDGKGTNCWEKPVDDWHTWPASFLSATVRNQADYAFFSYYPYKDCPNLNPSWNTDFDTLGNLFPNAKLGFGEMGTSQKKAAWSIQSNLLTTYYTMLGKIQNPRYVGGVFWWYYAEEMVPYTGKYWQLLDQTISTLPAPQ